jgi:transcription initiation factor TFIIB
MDDPLHVWDIVDKIRECSTPHSIATSSDNEDAVIHTPKCSHCDGEHMAFETDGTVTCTSCGTLVDLIDIHMSDADKDVDCIGCSVDDTMPQSSLATFIGKRSNESYAMARIRRYHLWNVRSNLERKMHAIQSDIQASAHASCISPAITDHAKALLQHVTDLPQVRGSCRKGIVASTLYAACQANGAPRSAKEIAQVFGVDERIITKGSKRIQDTLMLNPDVTTASDFVGRYCSRLGICTLVRDKIGIVVRRVMESGMLDEFRPSSVAAACIQLCSDEFRLGIMKKSVVAACEASATTINKALRRISSEADALLDGLV